MQPDLKKINIHNNVDLLIELLGDLVLQPRIAALKWSKITKQTPNIKIGYPAQHIASLVTGMEGSRTGARGKDIVDGSEVKACSKIDQLDTCNDCKEKVSRSEESCPACGSSNIKRMDDSKWLFTIRSEEDLETLTKDTPRIILVVSDYPDFEHGNYDDIRFEVFELWTASERNSNFTAYMVDYYHNIYLKHKQANPAKTPAPKNFFPYGYPFYMCNPIKVFSATIVNANTKPKIALDYYIEPEKNRNTLTSELMPIELLNKTEIKYFTIQTPLEYIEQILLTGYSIEDYERAKNNNDIDSISAMLPYISEQVRSFLSLREVGQIRVAKIPYKRGQR